MGFGKIAQKFFADLQHIAGQQVVAIATKSKIDEALGLLPKHQVYNSYQALVDDPNVEVIYINTTHNFHFQQLDMCVRANKPVICEKPMLLSTAQIEAFKLLNKNIFIMEAMWTRYLPPYRKAMQLIKEGVIGEIKWAEINFCYNNPGAPEGRLQNPALAGGAMYDIGIYPLAMAMDLMNNVRPKHIFAQSIKTDKGIDLATSFDLSWSNGFIAKLLCAIDRSGSNKAIIYGTEGKIVLYDFWRCRNFEVFDLVNDSVLYEDDMTVEGYYYEILEVINCLENKLHESPLMTRDHSIVTSEVMVEILNKVGYGSLSS